MSSVLSPKNRTVSYPAHNTSQENDNLEVHCAMYVRMSPTPLRVSAARSIANTPRSPDLLFRSPNCGAWLKQDHETQRTTDRPMFPEQTHNRSQNKPRIALFLRLKNNPRYNLTEHGQGIQI